MINRRLIDPGGISCTTNTLQVLGDSSCIAYYKLDGDATDESGNYNGTATAITWGTAGQFTTAGDFNGTTSVIDTSLTLDTSAAFAFSFWVKLDALAADKVIIGIEDGSSPFNGLSFGVNATQWQLFINGSTPADGQAGSPVVGTWYHIAVSYNGSGTVKYYENNTLIATSSSTVNNGTNALRLGLSEIGVWGVFDGLLDQVRIFNKELSVGEVDTLYNEILCV